MADLLAVLTESLLAEPWFALVAAFVWGILSVVLSPCHLAGIPVLVAYLSADDSRSTKHSLNVAVSFALGILLSIVTLGLVTAALGMLLGTITTWGNYLVAGLFLYFGLHLMDIVPLPFSGFDLQARRKRGVIPAFTLGAVFGLALGPCTFAFAAPVLGAAYQAATASFVQAVLLVAFFAAGHTAVIVVAGSSVTVVKRLVAFQESGAALVWLRRGSGLLVVLAGLYLLMIA